MAPPRRPSPAPAGNAAKAIEEWSPASRSHEADGGRSQRCTHGHDASASQGYSALCMASAAGGYPGVLRDRERRERVEKALDSSMMRSYGRERPDGRSVTRSSSRGRPAWGSSKAAQRRSGSTAPRKMGGSTAALTPQQEARSSTTGGRCTGTGTGTGTGIGNGGAAAVARMSSAPGPTRRPTSSSSSQCGCPSSHVPLGREGAIAATSSSVHHGLDSPPWRPPGRQAASLETGSVRPSRSGSTERRHLTAVAAIAPGDTVEPVEHAVAEAPRNAAHRHTMMLSAEDALQVDGKQQQRQQQHHVADGSSVFPGADDPGIEASRIESGLGLMADRGASRSSSLTSLRRGQASWPLLREGFEPLGPMLRSLEFQVGALFELVDAHSSLDTADRSVAQVIDRKRETVADTFDAVKEALWWQQRRQRQAKRRSRDGEGPSQENGGMQELEALQSQLAQRVAAVVEDGVLSDGSLPSTSRSRAPAVHNTALTHAAGARGCGSHSGDTTVAASLQDLAPTKISSTAFPVADMYASLPHVATAAASSLATTGFPAQPGMAPWSQGHLSHADTMPNWLGAGPPTSCSLGSACSSGAAMPPQSGGCVCGSGSVARALGGEAPPATGSHMCAGYPGQPPPPYLAAADAWAAGGSCLAAPQSSLWPPLIPAMPPLAPASRFISPGSSLDASMPGTVPHMDPSMSGVFSNMDASLSGVLPHIPVSGAAGHRDAGGTVPPLLRHDACQAVPNGCAPLGAGGPYRPPSDGMASLHHHQQHMPPQPHGAFPSGGMAASHGVAAQHGMTASHGMAASHAMAHPPPPATTLDAGAQLAAWAANVRSSWAAKAAQEAGGAPPATAASAMEASEAVSHAAGGAGVSVADDGGEPMHSTAMAPLTLTSTVFHYRSTT